MYYILTEFMFLILAFKYFRISSTIYSKIDFRYQKNGKQMNTTYLESQTPENYVSNLAVFAQIYFIMSYINTIWEDFVRNLPQ